MVSPSSVPLEYAKILFAPQDFKGVRTEFGGNDTFHEETRHRFGCFAVYYDIEGNHRTERRDRIARESLPVRVEGRRACGESARCGVLHDRTARFILERIGCEESALQIEQVVEGMLLTSFLQESGDSVVPALDIKRSALPRILSVTERARLL